MLPLFLFIYTTFISQNFLLSIIFFILPPFLLRSISPASHIATFIFYYVIHFFLYFKIYGNKFRHTIHEESNNGYYSLCIVLEIIKNIGSIYYLSTYIINIIHIYNKHIGVHYGLISIMIVLFLISLIENSEKQTTSLYNILKIIFIIMICYILFLEKNISYKIITEGKSLYSYESCIIYFLIILFSEKYLQKTLLEDDSTPIHEWPSSFSSKITNHTINILTYVLLVWYIEKHINTALISSIHIIPELFLKNYTKKISILHFGNAVLMIIILLEIIHILKNTKKLIQKIPYNKNMHNTTAMPEIATLLIILISVILLNKFIIHQSNVSYVVILLHVIVHILFLLALYKSSKKNHEKIENKV